MAHQLLENRRTSIGTIPIYNPIAQSSDAYELIKAIKRKYQFRMGQHQLPSGDVRAKRPLSSGTKQMYANMQVPRPMMNRSAIPWPYMNFPIPNASTKPLRIIIIRHSERVDTVLGADWFMKSFDGIGRYVRFNEQLPERLPTRFNLQHYAIDVPLTNRGRLQAIEAGKSLLSNGYAVDFCYSSPALRCVQSADDILSGMGRKGVSLNLEPGLYECYLNDFNRTLCFMTKDELASNGYHINKSYQPLMPYMRAYDSQLDYYERCRFIMNMITQRHQATGGTILIVGHAPSLEGLTRHLVGGVLQPERLFDMARGVPFLGMTILEKSSANSPWVFRTQQHQAVTFAPSSTYMPMAGYQYPYQQWANLRFKTSDDPMEIDKDKFVKSSTEPNFRRKNFHGEITD